MFLYILCQIGVSDYLKKKCFLSVFSVTTNLFPVDFRSIYVAQYYHFSIAFSQGSDFFVESGVIFACGGRASVNSHETYFHISEFEIHFLGF